MSSSRCSALAVTRVELGEHNGSRSMPRSSEAAAGDRVRVGLALGAGARVRLAAVPEHRLRRSARETLPTDRHRPQRRTRSS